MRTLIGRRGTRIGNNVVLDGARRDDRWGRFGARQSVVEVIDSGEKRWIVWQPFDCNHDASSCYRQGENVVVPKKSKRCARGMSRLSASARTNEAKVNRGGDKSRLRREIIVGRRHLGVFAQIVSLQHIERAGYTGTVMRFTGRGRPNKPFGGTWSRSSAGRVPQYAHRLPVRLVIAWDDVIHLTAAPGVR